MKQEIIGYISMVVPGFGCPYRCPICISRMTTPKEDFPKFRYDRMYWPHFHDAVRKAVRCSAKSFMFTSKTEATRNPQFVLDVLRVLDREYPEIDTKELQTNGIDFYRDDFKENAWLWRWKERGLNTVALSVVHWDNERNHEFYNPHQPEYPDLSGTIAMLHRMGYQVRLSVIMVKGFIDNSASVEKMVNFARDNDVDELSIRPVSKPYGSTFNPKVAEYVETHALSRDKQQEIRDWIEDLIEKKEAIQTDTLPHGAAVYEVRGQNLCYTDCLTIHPEEGNRAIIIYANGEVHYDWAHTAHKFRRMSPECTEYLSRRQHEG